MEEEVEAEVEAKKMEEGAGEERGGGGGGGGRQQEMCATLHWRICMVIKMASKPPVLFFHRQLEIKIICNHFSASLLF